MVVFLSHNIKAVYQRNMGRYDANPVSLNLLNQEDTAKKWVKYLRDLSALTCENVTETMRRVIIIIWSGLKSRVQSVTQNRALKQGRNHYRSRKTTGETHMRRLHRMMTALCMSVVLLAGCMPVSAESKQETAVLAETEQAESGSEGQVAAESEQVEQVSDEKASFEQETSAGEKYTLDKVVILSRHNIRSPLGRNGSLVGDITAHEWFEWTSDPGELSRRGAILETIMGQYFRLRVEEEGLFPENYIPEEGAVRFYANARQRTIATAHYFSAGLLPVANPEVETQAEYDTNDPVFHPVVRFTSKEYEAAVLEEIAQMGEDGTIEGIHARLDDAIQLLMKVIDPEETKAYQSREYGDLLSPETSIAFKVGEEPAMQGAIKTATQLADALTCQYYEEEDSTEAAFGEKLSWEDWLKIHTIVDTYQNMLFGTKLLAVNEAHLLLQVIRDEMEDLDKKFSYLCGHDSNMASVLTSLDVEPYELPGTMEAYTPIGGKLVFERWIAEDGEAYYTVNLVYQSAEQLKKMTMLSSDEPPMCVPLSFEGIEVNTEGMIPEQELLNLMDHAINLYDEIKVEYNVEDETTSTELEDQVEETEASESETEVAA